jgi:hypothetical protein
MNAIALFNNARNEAMLHNYADAVALFDKAVASGLLFDGISAEAAGGFAKFRADCVAKAEKRAMDDAEMARIEAMTPAEYDAFIAAGGVHPY